MEEPKFRILKKLFFYGLLFLAFSCKSEKENENENTITKAEVKKESKSEIKTLTYLPSISPYKETPLANTILFCEQLHTDKESQTISVPLKYRRKYSDAIFKILLEDTVKTVYKSEYTIRYKLKNATAEYYLDTKDIDSLLLIDEQQKVIDTLTKVNYESYFDELESYFYATYSLPENFDYDKQYTAISLKGIKPYLLRKSISPIANLQLTKALMKRNNWESNYIHSNYHFTYKKDTISLIAFYTNKPMKESQYLLKNGIVKDSIINDFAIFNLTPIPIATSTEHTFIAECIVAESDFYWTSLLSIDLEDTKFMFYENNRIER